MPLSIIPRCPVSYASGTHADGWESESRCRLSPAVCLWSHGLRSSVPEWRRHERDAAKVKLLPLGLAVKGRKAAGTLWQGRVGHDLEAREVAPDAVQQLRLKGHAVEVGINLNVHVVAVQTVAPRVDFTLHLALGAAIALRFLGGALGVDLAELQIASQSIKELLIKIPKRPFRRSEKSSLGKQISARESLRRARRNFGSVIPKLVKKKDVSRPVIVLLDISGSMENYSRMMIHFVHNLMQKHKKVHAFLFGTKLTNISFQIKNKDIDVALKEISRATNDWAGGTRIRDSIFTFNKNWVRRVSSSNSIIFFITDGLDRDHNTDLFDQMERLQKSCYKLVWLNPLLRFEDFQPKSISIKRILPNVDAFLPIHSIKSIQNLNFSISKRLVKKHNNSFTWQNKVESQSKELF